MKLMIIFLELLSVTMYQNSYPNLEENYTINVAIDTMYSGKLYWNLNCELISDANQECIDSIVFESRLKLFDTCRITVVEHILEVESKSCAAYKAFQIRDILQNYFTSGITFVTVGEAVISENKSNTDVTIEIF